MSKLRQLSILGAFGLALVVASPAPLSASPTMILFNGKVVTADRDFSVHQAVAVERDRITAVGSDDEIERLAGTGTERIDLNGRTVIPGLVDNHIHIMRSALQWHREVRLDGVTSRAEALSMIGAKAGELGPGEWVLTGGGFSPNQFINDRSPISLAELDEAAPENPVLMQHMFGMGFANTLAFRAIDIDEDTDIAWLEIANDIDLDDDEQPTGTVRGAAMRRMLAKVPEPGPGEARSRAARLNRYLNQLGLTAVLDASGGEPGNPDFDAYAALERDGALTLRVFHLYSPPAYGPGEVTEFAAVLDKLPRFEDSDYFQRVGIGERLYGPVHDSMRQPAASSQEHMAAFASLARQTAAAGWHLHQHATHLDSINQHLDTFEMLAEEFDLGALRWTFAHADGVDRAALQRARRLGVMIATQSRRLITGAHFDHPLPLISFGDPPLQAMQASGVRWGLGTDTMTVAQSNPFWTLWWAVTGKAMNGEHLTEQTVTREEALVAHTRANARFLFREDDLGSLAPGKLADMLVLDRDYMTVPDDEIRLVRPDLTIVGGRIVYERP